MCLASVCFVCAHGKREIHTYRGVHRDSIVFLLQTHFTQVYTSSSPHDLQAPEPPVEKTPIPQEYTAMVATFDGLKEQIRSAASSPVGSMYPPMCTVGAGEV